MITVPIPFSDYIQQCFGAEGGRWIESLPSRVESLCGLWGLTLDGEPLHGGLGIAVPVRRGNEPLILKITWSDASTLPEVLALKAWQGRGAVRLLESLPEENALLLERLDSNLSLLTLPISEAIQISGQLLRRLAIPASDAFPTLRDYSQELAQNLPERNSKQGNPVPSDWIAKACEIATFRGKEAGSLLVNYDLHYQDVLGGGSEPWLAIDPKVLAGDVEFGIAQLFWCRWEEVEAERGFWYHFEALVDVASLNPELARDWTYVRCVDYWLWGLSVGLTYDPARCHQILLHL